MAGVVNFIERIKQTQLTIEARYGKRPVTPPPPEDAVEETLDLLMNDNGETVYEVKYLGEEVDEATGGEVVQEEEEMILVDIQQRTRQRKAQPLFEAIDDEEEEEEEETAAEEEEEDEEEEQEVKVEKREEITQFRSPGRSTRRGNQVATSTSTTTTSSPSVLTADEINSLLRNYGVLSCEPCQLDFQDFRTARAHNQSAHKTPSIACCGRNYTSRVRLYEHVKYHMSPEDIECEICQKRFKSRPNLKMHMEAQHADAEIPCKLCAFTCRSEKILRRHELTHIPVEERSVSCSHCDFRCNFPSQLKTHLKAKHSAVREAHVCDLCGKNFSTKGNLTNHHKSFHDPDAKRDVCGQCGKAVRRLSRHLNICQKKLDLKCPHCSNVHPNMHALKTHILRMHTKDKSKLTCEICQKVLSRETHLKVILIVMQVRLLNNSCLFFGNFQEHMATHTKTALYKCQFCSKEFYSNSNMYKHLRVKHQEQWQEQKELAHQ